MRLPALLLVAIVSLSACKNGEQPAPGAGGPRQPAPSASAPGPAASASAAGSAAPAELAQVSGKTPFDYPPARTTAQPGDHVLAPPRAWVDEALERGAKTQTFIFYDAVMVQPGAEGSLIKTRPGAEEGIANVLFIPIRRGERATPGDLVLTSWASGSGMQRAIVVEGGKPEAPRVRYLDLALDHPSGWGEKVDNLPPDSFHKLAEPGEVGTTVACQQGKRRTQWIVTHRSGKKLLGLGFAGQLRVLERADCQALPLVPATKGAKNVFVPVIGSYTEARLVKVEPKIGRVFVEYRHGNDKVEAAFGFGNVATELEPVAPGQK